jgi:hypothetical protein
VKLAFRLRDVRNRLLCRFRDVGTIPEDALDRYTILYDFHGTAPSLARLVDNRFSREYPLKHRCIANGRYLNRMFKQTIGEGDGYSPGRHVRQTPSVMRRHHAESSPADPKCLLENGVEYRCEVPGRGVDDL